MSKSENQTLARRKRIAEEIGIALMELGLNRKQLAERMGRQPSEVTRWLSGNHNFTSDLLEEISIALERPISGAEDVIAGTSLVNGYMQKGAEGSLCEPSCVVDFIDIPLPTAKALSRMARSEGKTLREFIRETLGKAAEKDVPRAADFCGIWGEGYPDTDEIRSLRTSNRLPIL